MKLSYVFFLLFGFSISFPSLAAPPSIIDFARAAKAAYDKENRGFEGYGFLDAYDELHDKDIPFNGFKISYFRSQDKKNIIAAVRGTENEEAFNENWYFNFSEISGGSGYTNENVQTNIKFNCKLPIANFTVRNAKFTTATSLIILGIQGGVDLSIPSRYYKSNSHLAFSSLSQMISSLEAKQNKYLDSKIYITGHSLGGFVAQFLAVMNRVSGFSFDAPALGDYWNIVSNSEFKNKKQQFLQSGLWFKNHRLQGDAVSKINCEFGHLGSHIVTHRHNYWDQMHRQSNIVTGPYTFLHDMGRFLEHLEQEKCTNDGHFCCTVDQRSWSRKMIAFTLSLD
ncbi:MAG: hypothetical protein AB8G05_06060 [Oligoflexales bacterium]